jgi:hypothetical protein
MKLRKRHLLPTALAVVACGGPSANDGGFDAGRDAGPDSGMDSGVDAGSDGGHDSGTPDSGTDGGCPHPDTGNDMTVRCTCEVEYFPDGGTGFVECCDPDIGNPCPICCFNPRDGDGGRMYYPDSGTAVCYC